MAIKIKRLGSDRDTDEGIRIGTVRRPPRGIRKEQHARKNFYDIWFPNLAPSAGLLKELVPIKSDSDWRAFKRRYLAEMKEPGPSRDLDLLAALSHQTNFSVGCYCLDEERCHRSILRELLIFRNAGMAPT